MTGRIFDLPKLRYAAWTLAFALYLVEFVPILLAPRVDGKPG